MLVASPGLARVGQAQVINQSLVAETSGGSVAPGAPAVRTFADEMPAFPGGDVAFHHYLAEKIKYPAEAWRRNQPGTVYMRFVVGEQGRIGDAEVARGCGHSFDEKAIRLVRLMPWWTPGRQDGQPVRVARTLPIIFSIRH
ncbi:energy transducer TonB [Hymenobacter nivis]|nr:energy transducer TonB [Hymenobacter nivis]